MTKWQRSLQNVDSRDLFIPESIANNINIISMLIVVLDIVEL